MFLKKTRFALTAIGIPCLYAIALRFIFGVDEWQQLFAVMSLTFIVLLPFVMGALTVYFSPGKKRKSLSYRIFAPWMSVFAFLVLTIAFVWEGWACWLMVLPIFLVGSSIGGIFGNLLRRDQREQKLSVSILVLIPVFVSPIEQWAPSMPAT